MFLFAELLSQGQATTQSSTGWNGASSRAVDGNVDANYWKNSCTHTREDDKAWWQVTVNNGKKSYIDKVVLFNRADCCCKLLVM